MSYKNYESWPEALAALVKKNCLEDSELGDISVLASASGYTRSNGTVGAPGRLTLVSEILDPLQIDVSSTPDDGLNSYQGELLDISSRLSAGGEVVYTLTVYFDSRTAARLKESRCGSLGNSDTVAVGSSVTMTLEEPPTTSPSTSRKNRLGGT